MRDFYYDGNRKYLYITSGVLSSSILQDIKEPINKIILFDTGIIIEQEFFNNHNITTIEVHNSIHDEYEIIEE